MIFKVPKVPFLGFLSNARKLEIENICPDYFPESSIIVILLLKMFIVKNLTDFRKTVETGVDPRLTIVTIACSSAAFLFVGPPKVS